MIGAERGSKTARAIPVKSSSDSPSGIPEPGPAAVAHVRHLIVDRDGVLNVEALESRYVTAPDEWHWIPGSLEALAIIASADIRVSIATNQSGVGRGLMTPEDLDAVHAHMMRESEFAGGHVDALFVCTHAPAARCNCRKPAPGLIQAAVASSGIPATQTLAVGDDLRDVEAARAAGIAAALVLTGKGRSAARLRTGHTFAVFDDLVSLARALTRRPLSGNLGPAG
jgi:D-glycero-D-manno-heptose 1,7-bisphosphate phosphatase